MPRCCCQPCRAAPTLPPTPTHPLPLSPHLPSRLPQNDRLLVDGCLVELQRGNQRSQAANKRITQAFAELQQVGGRQGCGALGVTGQGRAGQDRTVQLHSPWRVCEAAGNISMLTA